MRGGPLVDKPSAFSSKQGPTALTLPSTTRLLCLQKVTAMTLSVDPEPQARPEFTGPVAENLGSAATREPKPAPSRGRAGLMLVAIVALLVGGLGGGLIGYAISSSQAEQAQAQALAGQRGEIAELQSDIAAFEEDISALDEDKAALEDSLASTGDQLSTCQVAVALAQQAMDNRQAAIDIASDPSLPLDPLDPAWDTVGDDLLQLDTEFSRLVGRYEVAATACMASVDVGATEA